MLKIYTNNWLYLEGCGGFFELIIENMKLKLNDEDTVMFFKEKLR